MKVIKKTLGRLLLAVIFTATVATVANAAAVSCNNVNVPQLVDASLTVSCGGVTFDTFAVVLASQGTLQPVSIITATFNAATGIIDLGFNPNVTLPQGGTYDIHVTYVAHVGSGLVVSIDGSVGQSFSSMVETVCTGGVTSGGACTGTQLASVTVFSGTNNQPIVSNLALPTGGNLFIFKDIGTSCTFPTQCPTGAALSSFSQSWHLQKIPEPASMLLFGFGLAGLGFW